MRKFDTALPLKEPHPVTGKNSSSVPYVQVPLGVGGITTPRFNAIVDSGCPYCSFRADFAKLLKLDLERGTSVRIGGVYGGAADTYFHKVKVYVESD